MCPRESKARNREITISVERGKREGKGKKRLC